MTSHLRRITIWGILSLLTLMTVSSCRKRFSILDYQFNVLSVQAGTWEDGQITRYPSVEVRVDGPDAQDWEISIAPDNGAMPYTEPAVTGRNCSIVLEGIDLSKDHREMGLTIKATHVNTGEVLATYRQYKASLEGNFDPVVPPAPKETIFVTGLSLVIDEESSSISVTDGHSATVDVLENYTASLIVSYSQDESETGPVSCTISQTEGKNHVTISQEGITQGESSFTIPFTSAEPGTGNFSVILKGNGPETVLVISYLIKSRPYEATFTPNHFTFADLYDAHGTVNAFGFRDGEKCNVVLRWKETTSGETGSSSYKGVNAKAPVDVILWKAGKTALGKAYVFWAEVYEEGETEPVAVTEEKEVSPFAISWAWTDTQGNPSGSDDVIRSWASSSTCKLDVKTADWAPEFIKNVTIKDVTAGRTYSSKDPIAGTKGDYGIEMKHPNRGPHQFSVVLETTEGDYSFQTEKTFIDVWTVKPYAKGTSLYLNFTGPASSIKTDCNTEITIYGYAIWDYTVAETDASGNKVNTPKQAMEYIGKRTEPFTIESGTASGSNIKVKPIAGLFTVAMKMLKEKCSDKPFSMTGLTATRWNGQSIVTYTPAKSNTFVKFTFNTDDLFKEDYNELETDISQLATTLNSNGIYY